MDSGLSRLGGDRLRYLRYSDAPRVAQAILDALAGHNRVTTGQFGDTPFVLFERHNSYRVAIRIEDWRKIFPLLRYGSGQFYPVIPPGNQPSKVAGFQPNRVVDPPREIPGEGVISVFEGLSFPDYSKVQQLLTASRVTDSGADYNNLVGILQQLFPIDFPTKV